MFVGCCVDSIWVEETSCVVQKCVVLYVAYFCRIKHSVLCASALYYFNGNFYVIIFILYADKCNKCLGITNLCLMNYSWTSHCVSSAARLAPPPPPPPSGRIVSRREQATTDPCRHSFAEITWCPPVTVMYRIPHCPAGERPSSTAIILFLLDVCAKSAFCRPGYFSLLLHQCCFNCCFYLCWELRSWDLRLCWHHYINICMICSENSYGKKIAGKWFTS